MTSIVFEVFIYMFYPLFISCCEFKFIRFQSYYFESTLGKNVIFLSGHNQARYKDPFVNALPWFHFGRKNVGYVFAIANGAKTIWDFDDDNILKFWIKGASPEDSLEIDHYIDNIDSK